MNTSSKSFHRILCLVGILILVSSTVLFAQQIPISSTDASNRLNDDHGVQDAFLSSYVPHSPITITSNADFQSQGYLGSGTPEFP